MRTTMTRTTWSISLVSGVALLLAMQTLAYTVGSSSVFKVDELEARWPASMQRPPERYRFSRPISIFRVDLPMVAQAFQQRHPLGHVESVRRVLPNRIVVQMLPQQVIAQIHLDKYYLVSLEGTILTFSQSAPWSHLPILFLDLPGETISAGEPINHPDFAKVAQLLAAVIKGGGIHGRRVTRVNWRGQDLFLELERGPEIRFSLERLESGWLQMKNLLERKPTLLDNAWYLDFRFEDPVIGGATPAPKKSIPRKKSR